MNEDIGSIKILDELMRDVRRMAREKDVSIPDIIHEALGEYIYMRSERINYADIIHSIEDNMSKIEYFAVNTNPYDFVVHVKSPLQYVNRPALKYKVRIMQDGRPYTGEMSVALRSHNINTLKSFSAFLNFWIELEANHAEHKPDEQIEYMLDSVFYRRRIILPLAVDHDDAQIVGQAIGDYISTFDELFKFYFYHPNCSKGEIERMYVANVKTGKYSI